tara:strand:+ start:111 stop:608 length:498 start_codon:yes stop_codon:yes gene_type:complete
MADKKPLLTYSFIEYISNINLKDKTLVEFGAGNSSIFFSNRFKYVISYEDNEEYINHLNNLNIPNLFIRSLDFRSIQDKSFESSIKNADYILVDNDIFKISRETIVKNLIGVFNYQNAIILDNSNWNPQAYFYLRRKYKNYKDFGWKNVNDEETLTSLFWDRLEI